MSLLACTDGILPWSVRVLVDRNAEQERTQVYLEGQEVASSPTDILRVIN